MTKASGQIDRAKTAFLELANRGKGLTPIKYIYSEEGSFEDISASSLRCGIGDFSNLYSEYTTVTNLANITGIEIKTNQITNLTNHDLTISPYPDKYLIISGVTFRGSTISAVNGEKIKIGVPVLLSEGKDDYISFLPARDTQCTYRWPNPPGLISPGLSKDKEISANEKSKVKSLFSFDFLTSTSAGELSWENQLIVTIRLISEDLIYLSSDSEGNMTWETAHIPASIPEETQTVEVGPYITSDASGNMSWETTTVVILPIPIPIILSKDKITVNNKEYSMPPFKKGGVE